jgi:hypothetical protein
MREGNSMFPAKKSHSIKLLFAIVVITQPVSQGRAQSVVVDRWGWGYCAPPYRPACIDNFPKNPQDRANCETVIKGFVDQVVHYRICLSAESARAVLEANLVLDALRCAKSKESCPVRASGKERPARPR